MMTDGRFVAFVSATAAVTAGSILAAVVAWSDGPSGPAGAFLFLVCLFSVLALFASVIVSADRFVKTLPPPPGRKHGVVRRFFLRQLGRIANLIRAGLRFVWRAAAYMGHAVQAAVRAVMRTALQPERRAAIRARLTRVTHRAVEVGFGGPPDEVECARQVSPRFEGRHARPERAGDARRPRPFRSPIAPHDALAIVMQKPPVAQRDVGAAPSAASLRAR